MGRHTPLSAELQRAARRAEKAFFSKHRRKLEESNKSRKTEVPQEKGKGGIWPRVGTIKDRNGRELADAGEVSKRWREYTELYKKNLNEPDYYNGVLSHPEPDILECEVKWALGSITMNIASAGDVKKNI